MKNSEPIDIDVAVDSEVCDAGHLHITLKPSDGKNLTNVSITCGLLSLIKQHAANRGISLQEVLDFCLPYVDECVIEDIPEAVAKA